MDDDGGEEQRGDDEEGSLWADGAAGEERVSDGVSIEKVALGVGAGVCDAVEEGLGPIPGGVDANSPPEGAGAPEGEGEDSAGETYGEDARGGLSLVAEVSGHEEADGEDKGGDPEADDVGVLVGGGEGASKAGDAAGDGVLEIAAGEELLKQADEEKDKSPFGGVDGCDLAVEGDAFKSERMREEEGADEERQGGDAPEEAGEEVLRHAGSDEAVAGEGASFNEGHNESGEEEGEEADGFWNDGAAGGHVMRDLDRAFGRRRR